MLPTRSPLTTITNKKPQRLSFGKEKEPLKIISGTDREELRNKKKTPASKSPLNGSKKKSSPLSTRSTPSVLSTSPDQECLQNLQERLKLAMYNMELHEIRIKELENENSRSQC